MRNHSSTTSANGDSFRRLEVITGVGRRRRWTWRTRRGSWPRASIRRRPPRQWPGATGCTPASSSSGGSSCNGVHHRLRRAARRGSCRCCWRRTAFPRPRPWAGWGALGQAGVRVGADVDSRSTAAGTRGGAEPGGILVPPGVRILLANAAGRLPQGHGWFGRPG